jgi:O-antigen/teichoic acid export membrane protein
MKTFSGESMVLMILQLVVWDRSDVIFLKMLNADLRQITFFTIAFNLTERALTFPQTFGHAVGATVMAQYGRDASALRQMTGLAAKYMFMFAAPLLLGLAALSGPAIQVLYGQEYLPAIPVLALAALYAIPKPLLMPAQRLLQAGEKQKFLVAWTAGCGVVNIVLDILLIPNWGAAGAALANGAAQTLAVLGVWTYASRVFNVHIPFRHLGAFAFAGFIMAAVVYSTTIVFQPLTALIVGPAAGALVYAVLLRLTRSFDSDDGYRLLAMERAVPAQLRGAYRRVVQFLIPAGSPSTT